MESKSAIPQINVKTSGNSNGKITVIEALNTLALRNTQLETELVATRARVVVLEEHNIRVESRLADLEKRCEPLKNEDANRLKLMEYRTGKLIETLNSTHT